MSDSPSQYALHANGSLTMDPAPFAADGRVQTQNPCTPTTNVLTEFAQFELWNSWSIGIDTNHAAYALQAVDINGKKPRCVCDGGAFVHSLLARCGHSLMVSMLCAQDVPHRPPSDDAADDESHGHLVSRACPSTSERALPNHNIPRSQQRLGPPSCVISLRFSHAHSPTDSESASALSLPSSRTDLFAHLAASILAPSCLYSRIPFLLALDQVPERAHNLAHESGIFRPFVVLPTPVDTRAPNVVLVRSRVTLPNLPVSHRAMLLSRASRVRSFALDHNALSLVPAA